MTIRKRSQNYKLAAFAMMEGARLLRAAYIRYSRSGAKQRATACKKAYNEVAAACREEQAERLQRRLTTHPQ